MPATKACAGSGRRPAHSASALRWAEAVVRLRLPEFRRPRYRTFLLPGRAIWTSRRELPSTDQARCHVHRAQWGPARLQTSAVEALASTDRPHKRRLTAGRRSHLDRDVAAAAGSQASEQPLKNFCASGMIIGDIGHQLPCLLPDFEKAARLADGGDIVLCVEQRAQKCGKIFCRSATEAEAARDLVKKLHADQFAGEVQQVAASSGPNNCTMTGAAVRTNSIA